jgi:hypothetical protein
MHFGSVDDSEKLRCFAEGTDVLTKDGFKLIQDVVIGELIASMNPETREIEYHPVTQTFAYDYEGDMVVAGTEDEDGRGPRRIRFCVTPNHKMLGRTVSGHGLKEFEARDMLDQKPYKYYLSISGKYNGGNRPEYFEIQSRKNGNYKKNGRQPTKFPIIPFLKFLGWYLSEGSTKISKSKEGVLVSSLVVISQTNIKGRNQIEEDLTELGLHFGKDKDHYYIYSKDLYWYCKKFGKCIDKYIPRDILDMHPDLLQYLFSRLIMGDGHIRPGKDKNVYHTTSRKLADDFNELSIKLGYSTFERKPQLSPLGKNWVFIISAYKNSDANLCVAKTSKNYKGKVYCVEVEPHHSLFTRYDGCTLCTKNSSEWSYIWVEEATELSLLDFKILRTRLRAPTSDGNPNQMFLSFNPTEEKHWIKKDVLDKIDPSKVEEIHSTYKDNPFLSEEDREELEDLINQDRNFWRIMALGEWGRLENIVYSNWDNNATHMPDDVRVIYGVDFGFNQPSVLLKLGYIDYDVWEQELIYEPKLTNAQFIVKCKAAIPPSLRNAPIYCDSAEPDRILEMQHAGLNAKLADKRVVDGVDLVKRFKIHILTDSGNAVKEKSGYVYQTNKNGEPLDVPVTYDDHCYDRETEILTEDGFKLFRYLTENDKVMTLDTENDYDMVFEKPEKIIAKQYKGEMYHYKGRNVDFNVTPDQLMLLATYNPRRTPSDKPRLPPLNFRLIKDFNLTSTFVKTTSTEFTWHGKNRDFIDVGHGNKITFMTMATIIGYYLSNIGFLNHETHSVCLKNAPSYALEEINMSYKKKGKDFYFLSEDLYWYIMKNVGEGNNRHIPQIFKNATTEVQDILINSFIKSPKNPYKIPVLLRCDFEEMLFKLGKNSRIGRLHDRHNSKSSFYSSALHKGFVNIKPRYLHIEQYDGMVYDVRVKSGIIALRRNGLLMWGCNCMTAERYAIYTHLKRGRQYKVRWL